MRSESVKLRFCTQIRVVQLLSYNLNDSLQDFSVSFKLYSLLLFYLPILQKLTSTQASLALASKRNLSLSYLQVCWQFQNENLIESYFINFLLVFAEITTHLTLIQRLTMIKRLSQELIALIAAGQSVPSPSVALKQLLENAMDAKADTIKVVCHQAGLSLIQVTDNGQGIMKSDLALLCQRFATSKIKSLGDLRKIQSFGFRGQALASLSCVSDIKVISRHKSDQIGYQAIYHKGKLKQYKALASPFGTTIIVQSLFKNMQVRKLAMNRLQQKTKLIKVCHQFALEFPQLKISLKTQKGQDFNSTPFMEHKQKGRTALFASVVGCKSSQLFYRIDKYQQIQISMVLSKISTKKVKKQLFLMVNHRIISSNQLQKAISSAYDACYQSIYKQEMGFSALLSLIVPFDSVDVNVHPSKKVVKFAGQMKLSMAVKQIVQKALRQNCQAKSVPIVRQTFLSQLVVKRQSDKQRQIYDYDKVRQDSKQLPLGYFLNKQEIHLKFKRKEGSRKIKNFFSKLSFVGCVCLTKGYFQLQTQLILLDFRGFLQDFVREQAREKGVFLVQRRIKLKSLTALSQLGIQFIEAESGFKLQQDQVVAIPVIFKQFNELVTEEAVHNFFQDVVSRCQIETSLIKFLVSPFNQSSKLQKEQSRKIMQQSMVPLLKQKQCLCEQNINFVQLLDLRKMYHVFQRC